MALPDFVVELWSRYESWIWILGVGSAITLVLSMLLVPFLIVILPADYYSDRNGRHVFQDRPLLRFLFLLVKNALGVVLLLAGAVMILLPGQGLLTMLAGLALLNFPGKHQLEMRVLHAPRVFSSVNWLRVRAGRKPLTL
ncbi:MAG: PGPGW domain-containing protein [Burkholderiales bacterium]|jgi:MFS family permease